MPMWVRQTQGHMASAEDTDQAMLSVGKSRAQPWTSSPGAFDTRFGEHFCKKWVCFVKSLAVIRALIVGLKAFINVLSIANSEVLLPPHLLRYANSGD